MVLGHQDDIEVVAEAGTGLEAIEAARTHHPDVILMDIRMPEMDGLEATSRIVEEADWPVRVLILTTFDPDEYVYKALRAGASGFVLDVQNLEFMDSACLGCLVKALNHAAGGGGRIALANAEAGLLSLFRTTSLDRLVPICHDVPSALAQIERGSSRR